MGPETTPRPKSPAAPAAPAVAPEAANGSQSPSGPSSRKRPVARRDSLDEHTSGNKDSAQKRRRRAFSCLSCQRLKCRCEYDPGAQGCHRCQTLRIACSLRGQNAAAPIPNSAETASRPGVEERLQRHEDALQEIKTMIQALGPERQRSPNRSSRVRAGPDRQGEEDTPATNHDTPDPEYLLNPVDRGSKSAPIVVLREISQHVTLGFRRMVGHGNPDLVQLQLLDEQTASELIELFIKHQGHTLLVRSYDELRHCGGTRQVSAFLHSVCCLIGVVYRDDICGTPLHRQVYEQVRITVGQAVLCSPLDLDDLNAMFIMSNNANTPSSQGVEYIDSWLLTGYCVKQAMLSIYFTQIVNRLKRGNSTIEDHRTMHLWSTICLHHLHWAATTGRPSIIPKGSHINQCNVLLSFYQATMQDGMLVAEIMLYSTLHQKLLHESYPSDGSECEEFRTWKQKWNHLLALPTSQMLRVGYHAACLILAVRALGKTGDALGSTSLLSTDNTPVIGTASLGSSRGGEDAKTPSQSTSPHTATKTYQETEPASSADRPGQEDSSSSSSPDASVDELRANVCLYARLVLETFLSMPAFVMDTAPTCTCLCLGYCALVLAHYDAAHSRIPDAVVLSLITRLDRWVQTSPGKAWSYKYGALAIRKVETRVREPGAVRREDLGNHNTESRESGRREAGLGVTTMRDCHDGSHVPLSGGDVRVYSAEEEEEMLASTEHNTGPGDNLPSFDMGEHGMFPSMEGFFGGGFLDFMR